MVQVRELRMDWRQAAGPCVARALAQTLWAGEGYYLQARARTASHVVEPVAWEMCRQPMVLSRHAYKAVRLETKDA